MQGPAGNNHTWDAVTALHSAWAKYLSPHGVTGYTTGNVWGKGRVTVNIHLPGARNEAQLHGYVNSVIRDVNAAGRGSATMSGVMSWKAAPAATRNAAMVANDLDFSGHGGKTFPGNGENKIIASWLYGARELSHPNLKQVLMASSDSESLLYSDWTGGPGVHKSPLLRGGGNAVGPGWRSALVRPAAELQWTGDDMTKLARRKTAAAKFTMNLASLNRSMGMYVNEADPDTVNAQQAFWGTNYPKLLSIKQSRDPKGVFWCKACVGAEFWTQSATGVLCTT